MRPINHQCDLIRHFLNTHSGFDRSDLQNYLNLYCFMNSGHKKKLEKVDEFIQLAFNTNVNLKYRSLFETSTSEWVTCANSDFNKIKNVVLWKKVINIFIYMWYNLINEGVRWIENY